MADNIQINKNRWESEKRSSQRWERFVNSPWRPSGQDIENYKKGIQSLKQKGNAKIRSLILGATPELRDLAATPEGEVTVADYSLNMLRQMAKLTKLADKRKEKWILADWRKLFLSGENSFELILGDLILRLIPHKEQSILLKKIADSLTPQGFFITRIHFINKSFQDIHSQEIINEVLKLSYLSAAEKANLIVSRILDKNSVPYRNCRQIKDMSVSDINGYYSKNIKKIKVESKNKEILDLALLRLEGVDFFPQAKKEIEKKLSQYLDIKKILIANDYEDSIYFPIYVLGCKAKY